MLNVADYVAVLKAEEALKTPELLAKLNTTKTERTPEAQLEVAAFLQAVENKYRLEWEIPTADQNFFTELINGFGTYDEPIFERIKSAAIEKNQEVCTPILIKALSNPNPLTRIRVLTVLQRLSLQKSYVELAETLVALILTEVDEDVISKIDYGLGNAWSNNQLLLDLFLDRANQALLNNTYSIEQRQKLANLMARTGTSVYPYVLALLQNSELPLQKLGLGMLSSSGWYAEKILLAVLSFVASEDLEIRLAALSAINMFSTYKIRNSTELPSIDPAYFLPSLKSADERLRLQAITGLERYCCKIPNPQVLENVLITLADPVAEIANLAAYAASAISKHSPEILDRLLALLESPDTLATTKVEILKAFYLSQTKEPQVVAKFWEYWESDNFRLKEVAAVGIAHSQPEFQPAMDFLLENLASLSNLSLGIVIDVIEKEKLAIANAEDILLQILTGGSKVSRTLDFIILNILTEIATSETVSKLEALLTNAEKAPFYNKFNVTYALSNIKQRLAVVTEN